MRIWVQEIGEPLPLEKNVRLHRYGLFTKALAEKGHDVTWWTSSFSHAPKSHLVEKDSEVNHSGAKIKLIKGPGYPRNISIERIKHNRHFAKTWAEMARKEIPPDLIIAPIPIIETAVEAVKYAKENNIPVLLDIRDEWPDELRDIAPKPLRKLAQLFLSGAYRKMKYVCQNVTGIMGVAEKQVDYGLGFANRKKSPNDQVFYLGYELKTPSPETVALGEEWYKQQNFNSDLFTVCFFGTLGKFFDLDTVIEVAKQLESENNPIQFIIGGDGSDLERLKQKAQGLKHFHFVGWVKEPEIQAIMRHSQVGLAPYKKDAKMSLPNKPFEYMSGKLAILSSLKGELEILLEKHQGGFSYTADDQAGLKTKLLKLKDNRDQTQKFGLNNYELLKEKFQIEKVFNNIENHFRKVANKT